MFGSSSDLRERAAVATSTRTGRGEESTEVSRNAGRTSTPAAGRRTRPGVEREDGPEEETDVVAALVARDTSPGSERRASGPRRARRVSSASSGRAPLSTPRPGAAPPLAVPRAPGVPPATARPGPPVGRAPAVAPGAAATRKGGARLGAGGSGARSGGARRRQPAAVYRRRRVLALGGVGAVALAAWVGVAGMTRDLRGASLGPSEDIAAHVVVVAPGDTLWSIALASGDRGDIRPLVDELSAEVHGQPLYVGERIDVP